MILSLSRYYAAVTWVQILFFLCESIFVNDNKQTFNPEVSSAQTLRIDFTVKKETSAVQQLNIWNENYLDIYRFWNWLAFL